jgi:hypothetical protein
MYILRAAALDNERGEFPDLAEIYPPGTLRQARRRLAAVWTLSAAWLVGFPLGGVVALATLVAALLGLVLAVSTQFEGAWIGLPVRPWTRYAIPVAVGGLAATFVLF